MPDPSTAAFGMRAPPIDFTGIAPDLGDESRRAVGRHRGMMAPVFIHGVDAGDESEWRAFLAAHPFGELVAGGGPERRVPVVVPTQFVLDGDDVLIHLLARNPVWAAIAENPTVAARRLRRLGVRAVELEDDR